MDKQNYTDYLSDSEKDTLKRAPEPGGMVAPVRENPRTVLELEETINPFCVADPPLASLIEIPAKSN